MRNSFSPSNLIDEPKDVTPALRDSNGLMARLRHFVPFSRPKPSLAEQITLIEPVDSTADSEELLLNQEIAAVRSTADLTSGLIKSLSRSIGDLKEISALLNQQSEELSSAMHGFVETMRQ